MKSIKDLIKIFNAVHSIFFALLLSLIFYLSFVFINDYLETNQMKDLYKLIIPVSLFIYLLIITYLTNKIEQRLYKENVQHIIELLLVHSLLYGIISPFALFNYYLIYMLLMVYKPEGIYQDTSKDDPYHYSKLFLKYGIYLFIPYIFYKYINLMIDIYYKILSREELFNINQIIYIGILIFAFFQLKVAEKEINQNKYINSSIRVIVTTIFINPFTFHGASLLTSAFITLYKDHNFSKVKEEFLRLKNYIAKKIDNI